MKKFLAALMAVAMLSTVAFADVYDDTYFNNLADEDVIYAGSELYLKPGNFVSDDNASVTLNNLGGGTYNPADGYEFNDDYFTITTKKFIKGSSLVEDIYFGEDSNDKEAIVIELAESTSLIDVTKPNFEIDEIVIRAKKDSDEEDTNDDPYFERNDTFTYEGGDEYFIITKYMDCVEEDGFDFDDLGDHNGYVFVVDCDGYVDAEFDKNEVFMYGRLYDGDEVLIEYDNDYDADVLKANPDADDVEFVQVEILGLTATWTMELAADEDDYLYELVDGVLVESDLEWDDDAYVFVGRVRESVSYVISDVELESAEVEVDDDDADVEEEEEILNPDTGASDVVGVAAALAIVSVIAGAAVSLKK